MTTELASGLDTSTTPIYPAFCFSASPTFNKWVKLTAADVHALRSERGFEGQDIYFHLNHPVRYVYLVGPIVAIEVLAAGKFFLLTLDDGSGATIDVKVEQILAGKTVDLAQSHDEPKATSRRSDPTDSQKSKERAYNAMQRVKTRSASINVEAGSRTASFTGKTTTEGVTIVPSSEDFNHYESHGHVCIEGEIASIGTIIKAKGHLQVWRDNFQLTLDRAFIVRTTDDEAQIWASYYDFARTVLCKPWRLSSQEVQLLERVEDERARKAELRRKAADRAAAVTVEKNKSRQKKRKVEDKRREKKRVREAEHLDGNALDQVSKLRRKAPGEHASRQNVYSRRGQADENSRGP